jgi:hypothetical protein
LLADGSGNFDLFGSISLTDSEALLA